LTGSSENNKILTLQTPRNNDAKCQVWRGGN